MLMLITLTRRNLCRKGTNTLSWCETLAGRVSTAFSFSQRSHRTEHGRYIYCFVLFRHRLIRRPPTRGNQIRLGSLCSPTGCHNRPEKNTLEAVRLNLMSQSWSVWPPRCSRWCLLGNSYFSWHIWGEWAINCLTKWVRSIWAATVS